MSQLNVNEKVFAITCSVRCKLVAGDESTFES